MLLRIRVKITESPIDNATKIPTYAIVDNSLFPNATILMMEESTVKIVLMTKSSISDDLFLISLEMAIFINPSGANTLPKTDLSNNHIEMFLKSCYVYFVWKLIRRLNWRWNVLFLTLFIFLTPWSVANSEMVDVYSNDESPMGISYENWIPKWWNWSYNIVDKGENNWEGLVEDGCLLHRENSMVMLVDTAAGGIHNQKCTISHSEAILIPIWTGECNKGENGCKDADSDDGDMSFDELLKKAKEFNEGDITGEVTVDDTKIAELVVKDLKAHIMKNVTEVSTGPFNATIVNKGHITNIEKPGTFPAAAHGWFVFLKPLQVGEHKVSYTNSVSQTGYQNSAQITYYFTVE